VTGGWENDTTRSFIIITVKVIRKVSVEMSATWARRKEAQN
jgi:hypothetical protein